MKENKKNNSLSNLEDLKKKLQPFKINQNEVKWIKCINFLNFFQESFLKFIEKYFSELFPENSKKHFSSLFDLVSLAQLKLLKNDTINSAQDKQERMNLYSIIILWLTKFTLSNENIVSYINSDAILFSLNFIISKFFSEEKFDCEIKSIIQQNWFNILFEFLTYLNCNTDFFQCNLPNLITKVQSFLKEINKENFSLFEFLFENEKFSGIRFDLIEILFEISHLHKEVREYSKWFYSELNNSENNVKKLKKKMENKFIKEEEREKIRAEVIVSKDELKKLQILDFQTIHKDCDIIIYKFSFDENLFMKIRNNSSDLNYSQWYKLQLENQNSIDSKAITGYLNNTVFLLKLRNNLIEYFKNFNLNKKFNFSSEDLNSFSNFEILSKLNNHTSIYNIQELTLSYNERNKSLGVLKLNSVINSDEYEMIQFKKTLLKMEKFITAELAKINRCWIRKETIQKLRDYLLVTELKYDEYLNFIYNMLQAVQHPSKINNLNNIYINSENEFNLFYSKDSIELTNERNENFINFLFRNKFLKEYFINCLELLNNSKISKREVIVFIVYFQIVLNWNVKSVIRKNERRSKIRDMLNRNMIHEANEIEDDTNDYSVSYVSQKKKNRIINDDEEDELTFD